MQNITQHFSASAVAGNANTDLVATRGAPLKILYGSVVLTTDATAVNRRVTLQILDENSNAVFQIQAGALVGPSSSNQQHDCMQGVSRETAFINSTLILPLAKEMILPKGFTFRISVDAGVAGDSYEVDFILGKAGL